MKKTIWVVILVILLAVVMVACTQPEPEQQKSALLGKWKSGSRYMTIKDNGTFIMENLLSTQVGTWSETEGKLIMIFDDDPEWHWVDGPYNLSDGVLTFTDDNETNWTWIKQE